MSCTGLKIQHGMTRRPLLSSAIESHSCGMSDCYLRPVAHIDRRHVGTSPNYVIRLSACFRQNMLKPWYGATRMTTAYRSIQKMTTRAGLLSSSSRKQMIRRRTSSPDLVSRYVLSSVTLFLRNRPYLLSSEDGFRAARKPTTFL